MSLKVGKSKWNLTFHIPCLLHQFICFHLCFVTCAAMCCKWELLFLKKFSSTSGIMLCFIFQHWFAELSLYFVGIPCHHLWLLCGGSGLSSDWVFNFAIISWWKGGLLVFCCVTRAIVFCVKCTCHCLFGSTCVFTMLWWCELHCLPKCDCILLAHQRSCSVFSFSALIYRVVTVFWGHTSLPLTVSYVVD